MSGPDQAEQADQADQARHPRSGGQRLLVRLWLRQRGRRFYNG